MVTGLLFSLAAVAAAACASIVAPAVATPERCVVDAALVGTWKDSRTTQLGPAWMEFTFDCDCGFRSRVQMLWMRITEEGRYRTAGEQIHFERKGGPTAWPYQIDGDVLTLTEHPTETHTYRRGGRDRCPGA
jgi:hypothetical protein